MITLEQPVAELLSEAADWRLIALLFECPRSGWNERLEAVASACNNYELKAAARSALAEASEGLYHSAFGPGGPAPPREATHRDTLQLGYLFSELLAFYQTFGFQPDSSEPPDHVSTEANFVAYLKLKQAFALNCGDTEAGQIVKSAEAEFLSEHLSSTAEPLAKMLVASGIGYLKSAGQALADRTGPAKKRFLVLGADSVAHDEDGFGCGSLTSS